MYRADGRRILAAATVGIFGPKRRATACPIGAAAKRSPGWGRCVVRAFQLEEEDVEEEGFEEEGLEEEVGSDADSATGVRSRRCTLGKLQQVERVALYGRDILGDGGACTRSGVRAG